MRRGQSKSIVDESRSRTKAWIVPFILIQCKRNYFDEPGIPKPTDR